MGELIALRRCDLDLDAGTVRVPRRLAELDSGRFDLGPTRSAAGARTVNVPSLILPNLREHLATFAAPGGEALSSLATTAHRCAGQTSAARSTGRAGSSRPGCRPASTSTTCGTRATIWRRRPARALVS